jgi:hypothetical protein
MNNEHRPTNECGPAFPDCLSRLARIEEQLKTIEGNQEKAERSWAEYRSSTEARVRSLEDARERAKGGKAAIVLLAGIVSFLVSTAAAFFSGAFNKH